MTLDLAEIFRITSSLDGIRGVTPLETLVAHIQELCTHSQSTAGTQCCKLPHSCSRTHHVATGNILYTNSAYPRTLDTMRMLTPRVAQEEENILMYVQYNISQQS